MVAPAFPLWPFQPNWANTITETLSWLTDVLPSKTGKEQRRKLRLYPRKKIEFTNLMTMRERAMHDSLMTSYGVHDWMLPLWYDVHHLNDFVLSGSQKLLFDTALLGEFRAGGYAMLSAGENFRNEVVQIDKITSSGITLTEAVANAWPLGTRVFPLQRARFEQMPQMMRQGDGTYTGSYSFIITEPDIRYFLPRVQPGVGTSSKGLVVRRYLPNSGGTIFHGDSGVTVGQVNMALATLRAFKTLSAIPDSKTKALADSYKALGFDFLDALLGRSNPNGAIIRQASPTNKNPITIPHWLYAARGPVGSLAEQGEGYEVFPAAGVLPGSFASAAPETFRDLDRALLIAADEDTRSASKGVQWSRLREALRGTNLKGRQISDGRAIFFKFPGGPIVPRGNQEPKGTYTRSTNPLAAQYTAGISSGITGFNFFSRDTNGDILIDAPTAYDYSINIDLKSINPETYTDSTGKKIVIEGSGGLGSTVSRRVIVTREITLGRLFKDNWRAATDYQKADQFLLVQFSVSRDIIDDEEIKIELVAFNGNLYSADLPRTGNGSLRNVLVSRTSFLLNGNGAALPAGLQIWDWRFKIVARKAYKARIAGMRLLSGDSEAAVSGNVNAAINGEPIPFLPGSNPFRVSGTLNPGFFVGYNGSPWTGAQTPDQWADLSGRISDFVSVTAATLPVSHPVSGAIVYPIDPKNPNGTTKPQEALLAEQALLFMRAGQTRFAQDNFDIGGPMAFTFVINTPDRITDYGGTPAHTWLYNNARTETDVFYQARAIEGAARLALLTKPSADYLVHMANPITFNGETIVYIPDKNHIETSPIGGTVETAPVPQPIADPLTYQNNTLTYNGDPIVYIYDFNSAQPPVTVDLGQIPRWENVALLSRSTVKRFIVWFDNEWGKYSLENLTFNGDPITYNGQNLVVRGDINTDDFANPVSHLSSPGVFEDREAPHTVALVLRSCMWMARVNDSDRAFYISVANKCYRYLNVRLDTIGALRGIPYFSNDELYWSLSEYILTAAELVPRLDLAKEIAGRDDYPVQWLEKAYAWLAEFGIDVTNRVSGFDRNYKGYSVLTEPPNEAGSMSIDIDRLTEEYDNQITMPTQADYEPIAFNRPQYSWFKAGRQDADNFRKMLYSMQGRAVPFWLPTHMIDVQLSSPIAADDVWLTIENIGYTVSGGPRRTRQHIMITPYEGTVLFREIVESQELDIDTERLRVDLSFRTAMRVEDIKRICFMDLSRLDQDGVQLQHPTDVEGVTSSTTVFRSVKA